MVVSRPGGTRTGTRASGPASASGGPGAPTSSAPTPRLQGRYTLGPILGHGSLGTTYRGYDHQTKRPVAIKLLSDRYVDDQAFADRFKELAEATARLRHPNIVAVLDNGVADGRPFLVTELVEGPSLRTLMSGQKRLSVGWCMRVALHLTDALCYAHGRYVGHGDLRPENVLFDARGRTKITDFGLVRLALASDRTLLGSDLSRAVYAPPVKPGRRVIDDRHDVYSVGALLYQMLTGSPPYTWKAWIEALRGSEPTPSLTPPRRVRPGIPWHVDRAVMCALSPHPPDGFLSMHELRHVLSGRGMSGTWSVPAPFGNRWADLVRWLPWPRRDRDRDRGHGRFPEWGILALLLAALVIGSADTRAVLDVTSSRAADGTRVDPATGAMAPPNGEYDSGSGSREEVRRWLAARGAPPDVVGLSPEEARAVLEQAGWTVAGVELGPEAGRPGTVVRVQPGPSGGGEPGSRSVTLAVDPLNVALNRPARLATGELGPAALVDGDPETVGQAEGPGASSVEIDLAQPGTVVAVELLGGRDATVAPSQVPSLLLADQRHVDFEAFAGPMADRQVVRVSLNQPMADVAAVRIATSDSTGELALREIRILGW